MTREELKAELVAMVAANDAKYARFQIEDLVCLDLNQKSFEVRDSLMKWYGVSGTFRSGRLICSPDHSIKYKDAQQEKGEFDEEETAWLDELEPELGITYKWGWVVFDKKDPNWEQGTECMVFTREDVKNG